MWYEILPSLGIICAAMAVPTAASLVANKLVLGNFYRRCLMTREQRMQYMRDMDLSGNPYKVLGLENIPDE